eukprot:TRINITY_DN42004_c0_g1_i1.p1 TRINITY_DN42004_c0_g1~~TRINITY_DN42004_c0_g1_i1.p1  ORF type:complete len:241 (-),score=23.41 TRINITY_DN42004_c0_g1_i1:140-862(-)
MTPARSTRALSSQRTQAAALQLRGELSCASLAFDVSLPTPGARARGSLGLGVRLVEDRDWQQNTSCGPLPPLQIENVDSRAGKFTPAAEWNAKENRQAHRGEGEHHQSFAIQPGDSICAVNGNESEEGMLEAMASAASFYSPKALHLKLVRQMPDTLSPSPFRTRCSGSNGLSPELPALRKPPRPRVASLPLLPTCSHRSFRKDDDASTRAPSECSSKPISRSTSRSSSRGASRSQNALR